MAVINVAIDSGLYAQGYKFIAANADTLPTTETNDQLSTGDRAKITDAQDKIWDGSNWITETGEPLGSVTIADGSDVAEGATTDAIVAAGAAGTISAKLRRVTQGLEDLKSLVVLAAGSAIIGKVGIDQTTPGTTNKVAVTDGASPKNSTPFVDLTVDRSDQQMKGSAGVLTYLRLYNPDAVDEFLIMCDAASITLGTTTPVVNIRVPAGGYVDLTNLRLNFATQIRYYCATASSGTGAPTTGLEMNASYE